MQPERLTDPLTGDTMLRYQHRSGLEIRIMEMPEFSAACAQLGTRYGSVHRRFTAADGHEVCHPAGIAHFLEHQLYEDANGSTDASARFGRLGASDNAYTAFDRTVYYFHTHSDFPAALEILLDFVLHPCFTERTVAKERVIIAQEIRECLDDPADRQYYQLLEGLYHSHPVREDVAGTLESIRQITPALLADAWRSFYDLHNMVLCCAGNVTAETILAIADRLLPAGEPHTVTPVFPDEPETVNEAYLCREMSVGKMQFAVGFKSRPADGTERQRAAILTLLVMEHLFGESSDFFNHMVERGLLTTGLGFDLHTGDGWFCAIAEGESDDPAAIRDAMAETIRQAIENGLDPERFAVLLRAEYGDTLISMNSPAALCAAMTDSFMEHTESPFVRHAILSSVTLPEAERTLTERLDPDKTCVSVIRPEAL